MNTKQTTKQRLLSKIRIDPASGCWREREAEIETLRTQLDEARREIETLASHNMQLQEGHTLLLRQLSAMQASLDEARSQLKQEQSLKDIWVGNYDKCAAQLAATQASLDEARRALTAASGKEE